MGRRWSVLVIAAALAWAGAGWAASAAQDDLKDHRSCAHCGMDRKAYGYARMLVVYEDGGAVGTCSLSCATVELNLNPTRKLKALLVADRGTRELTPAEEAVWVVGGSRPGVMTRAPKWAFATQGAAEAFIKSNGGKIAPWPEVLAAAKEETAQASGCVRCVRPRPT